MHHQHVVVPLAAHRRGRKEGVAYAVLQYVRRNLERPEMLRLLALMAAESSAPDHPAHEWFRDRYERTIGLLATAVRRD
ncbi:hypothetical protein [Nonomuraea sp. NPDC049158]